MKARYQTKSGNYTAEIIKTDLRDTKHQQRLVVVLTDVETGEQEIHAYTEKMGVFPDGEPSTLDLVEIPEYALTDKGLDELDALRCGGVL